MNNINYYKIKLIKKFLEQTAETKEQLLTELVTNATDPTVVARRIRMIKQLNLYEIQLLEKIQQFETNDITDLNNFNPTLWLNYIVNRSA